MKHQNVEGLTIAMVQMSIAEDPMQNARAFLAEARIACSKGADIVVGPEMMLTQYLSSDRYEDDAFIAEMERATRHVIRMSGAIKELRGAVLIFGGIYSIDTESCIGEDGRLRKHNAAYVAQNGSHILSESDYPAAIKTLMPNYRIFDDSRHFWSMRNEAEEMKSEISSLLQPFPVIIRGVTYKLGIMLCEDMWDIDYTIKPSQILKENGANILINLSASNWSWRKNQKRDRVVKDICEKTGLWFVYVNNVGCQNNGKNFITFDGASTVYNPHGEIVAMTERYEEETKLVTLDAGLPILTREEESDVAQLYQAIKEATHGFLETVPKNAKRKVVIGVSGGIDSALSVTWFAHLLGPQKVVAVNMPYKNYNSTDTRNDAEELCRRLGVEYIVVPIDDIVDATCRASGVEPKTPQHKTVQATSRMQVLSSIAAQRNGFFTCNANWTEVAFGYGTLNGDLRGAFAPWMNCLKRDVYRLAYYLNREVYGRDVIPQSIIDRPPMDELVTQGTTLRRDPFDYGTLYENGYHDQMVRAIVAFRKNKEWFLDCYKEGTLEKELQLNEDKLAWLFQDDEAFLDDLERCFKLFHGAIWKRVQSVPGPLVDKRSFGWDFRESILGDHSTTRYIAGAQLIRNKDEILRAMEADELPTKDDMKEMLG